MGAAPSRRLISNPAQYPNRDGGVAPTKCVEAGGEFCGSRALAAINLKPGSNPNRDEVVAPTKCAGRRRFLWEPTPSRRSISNLVRTPIADGGVGSHENPLRPEEIFMVSRALAAINLKPGSEPPIATGASLPRNVLAGGDFYGSRALAAINLKPGSNPNARRSRRLPYADTADKRRALQLRPHPRQPEHRGASGRAPWIRTAR